MKKTAFYGLFLALALICSYIDSVLFWNSGCKAGAYKYCCNFNAVLYGG